MQTSVGTLAAVSALATALAGCGRVGFAPGHDRGDGGIEGGSGTVDAELVTPIAISDDFEDDVRASFWTFYGTAPAAYGTETGGEYVITYADQTVTYAALGLFTSHAFTAAAVWVELAAPPPTGNGKTCYLGAAGLQVGSTGNGELQVVKPSGEQTTLVPFDFTAMRWWRIRGAGGFVRAETSPDGITWTEVTRIVQTPDLETTGVNLGGGTYLAVPGTDQCRYESFNEPP